MLRHNIMGMAISVALATTAGIARASSFTTLYSFTGGADGGGPSPLALGNGVLYGTTSSGGTNGHGVAFSIDPASSAETVIASFPGDQAGGGFFKPVFADGFLYGIMRNSPNGGPGLAYKIAISSGHETILTTFSDPNFHFPLGSVVVEGGLLYGVDNQGGPDYNGTIFTVDVKTGETTIAYAFPPGSHAQNFNNMIYHDGLFYGSSYGGGSNGHGYIFQYDPTSGSVSTVINFKAQGGCAPFDAREDPLTSANGFLFGVDGLCRKPLAGTIIRVDPTTARSKTLYKFVGKRLTGDAPNGGLVYVDGALYGTTSGGQGASKNGTIFKIDVATGVETVVYMFSGGASASPVGLVYDKGVLFGSTQGVSGTTGTVFAFIP